MIEVIHIKKSNLVRHPDYIYIGRGSIYGNPFSHLETSTAHVLVKDRNEAIEKYSQWLEGKVEIEGLRPPTLEEILRLDGKILGCFCKPLSCHGDVLKEIVETFKT